MDVSAVKTDIKPMKIILWGMDDLLSWSVISFLSTRKGWEVISLLDGQYFDDLIMEVESVHPDAIIVHQMDCARNIYLLTQILSSYPNITMITVNPDNNSIEMYTKKQVYLQSVSDLVSAIEGMPLSRKEKCHG